ncbi:hypothetical protein AMTRI_Chr05g60410 [Amborella trichopoda]
MIKFGGVPYCLRLDRRITSFLNQNQACASCPYKQLKCTPDCPMAPFIPPDSMSNFLNIQCLDPILGRYGIVVDLNKRILHACTLLNNLHGGSSFGTNSMHAPPPSPLLPLHPLAPALAGSYAFPWLVEDPMEQQQQKDFPNAWLTTMVAKTSVSTQVATAVAAAAVVYKK